MLNQQLGLIVLFFFFFAFEKDLTAHLFLCRLVAVLLWCHRRAPRRRSPSTVRLNIIPVLRPELDARSGNGCRQRVMITRVPQKKTNKSAFRIDKKEGEENEESMFVILLIIILFNNLQIGVYCVQGEEREGGYKMSG